MGDIDKACFILENTRDGDDLAPEHLKLLELKVNGFLNEKGEAAFEELYQSVKTGYKKPWLHGVEHLTRDHEGYIYWKGHRVEHYDLPWVYSDGAKKAAQELGRRCLILESEGAEISVSTAIFRWKER